LDPSLCFIAAGSGMVPIFSLLKSALAKTANDPILLITQNHDAGSILFRQELGDLARRHKDRFHWLSFLSSANGRLNNWLLEALVPPSPRSLYFLCGPPAFMRMAQFTLRLMGARAEQIRKEHFTVEYLPPPPVPSDTTPKNITIHRRDSVVRFQASWPSTILQAAEKNGIALPYSCRGGRCSTCVARCLQGTVALSINEVLTEKDLEAGLVLPCVGYAETDLELVY
jgi:ring-1,2-phenylacetyl-CoA epoxidase subunit PaaE